MRQGNDKKLVLECSPLLVAPVALVATLTGRSTCSGGQWLQQVRSSSGETARAMRVADGTSAGELPLFHPHHLPASVCAVKKLEVHVKAEL